MLAYPQDNARDVRDVLIEQQQDEISRLTKRCDELYKALLLHRPAHKEGCLCQTCEALASVEEGK